tara:strand:- start:228 stop:470 length:243 start_codon:yes stop_codon:yes gene_type:complete
MAVETTVTTITIELLNGGVSFIPTQVTASTVGELREELGLTGEIGIAQDNGTNVMASDVTELTDGMEVSHVPQAMKGGEE